MDTGDDILSVVFLALVCIVIAGIMSKITPAGMVMPTYALIALCLWIAYDYMLLTRYKAKAACLNRKRENEEAERSLEELADELEEKDVPAEKDIQEKNKPAEKEEPLPVERKPEQQHVNEFDIGIFNTTAGGIQTLHSKMGCGADTQIANRMKYMGLQAKLSQDIRARHNKHNLVPYFDEELKANESRDWWDAEQDHLDQFM